MVDFISESDPIAEMKALLEEHWKDFDEVNMPQIIVANDPTDPRLRIDLQLGDAIIIKMDGVEQLKQRYNFTYYDIFNPNKQERTTLSEAKRRCNSLVWIGIIEGYLLNTMNRLDIMLKIRKVYHLIDFGKLIDIVVKENDYENRILLFNKS